MGALCVSRSLASGVMLVFGIVTGTLFCGGVMNIGEIKSSGKLQEANEMGKQI